jgi:RNA polymerase-binding transcription factor DksA
MDEKFVELGEATQAAVVQDRLARVAAEAFPDKEVPVAKQTTHCIADDCGEPLPDLRIKRGQERCFECQTALERRQKRGF